ncbi:MAG: type VI secretion protein IcmF/TssM N-terminal domain-containing protein [Planctomycetaceae bacterium]
MHIPSFFYRILEWTRLLFGVMPRSGFGSAKVFLVIHYCFMVLLAILLGIFSDSIRSTWLGPAPDSPLSARLPEFVRDYWWGVAFVIGYCIVRIVLYLLELLGIEDESDFPDIEADWNEILSALDQERLPIDDIPLFLVNGFTPQQEQSAFEAASQIEWRVIAPPLTRKSAVLRAFANDDAIFLSCVDVGATNLQHGKVSNQPAHVPASANVVANRELNISGTMKAEEFQGAVERAQPGTGTMPGGTFPAAPLAPAPAPVAAAPEPAGGGFADFFGTIAPGGMQRAMETVTALRQSDAKGYGKKRLAPLSEVEAMIGARRISFVCQLIAQARHPYCPINGMLQAVPFSWGEDVEYARKLVPAIREDVIAVHEKLQLQFPVVVVVTELDDVSGMREFILRAERLQPGLRLSRAGSSFAAGADVNDRNAAWLIERAMQWFRGWVYSAFSYDLDSRDNQKLFNMLCEINQRQTALVTLLRDSLYKVVKPAPRLYGSYFCATGHASTEQGFIRGVLDKLPESQGDVAWTPQLSRSQQRASHLSWVFFSVAAILMTLTIWLFLRYRP